MTTAGNPNAQAIGPRTLSAGTQTNVTVLQILRTHGHTIFSMLLLFFINQFCYSLLEVSRVILFERVICAKHYDGDPSLFTSLPRRRMFDKAFNEDQCKIPQIQHELANIVGLKLAFDAIPGLLTANFYGSFADRKGRKPVALFSSAGELMALLWIMVTCYYFPIRMVWMSSFFLLLGGGHRILLSMLFSIIADTIGPDHRTRFMYMNPGIAAVSSLVAPATAKWMIAVSIWLPFQVALSLGLVSLFIILAMPEVWAPSKADGILSSPIQEMPSPLRSDHSGDQHSHDYVPLPEEDSADTDTDTDTRTIRQRHELPPGKNPLLKSSLLCCFTMFFLKRVGFVSASFVYQYVSSHFGWSLEQTTQLQFIRAIGATTVNIIVLPGLSTYIMQKRLIAPERLDKAIVGSSAVILALGFGALWAAYSSIGLYAATIVVGTGEGLEAALQGLAAFLVDRSHTARMFTTVAFLDLTARLIGGPLMTKLLIIGDNGSTHALEGLCFLVSAALFAIVAIFATSMQIGR